MECSFFGVAKSFVWSGRRDSNPRRPAWEIDYTLTIKNMAFMASIASDSKSPIFNDLVQWVPYRNKNGTKKRKVSDACRYRNKVLENPAGFS